MRKTDKNNDNVDTKGLIPLLTEFVNNVDNNFDGYKTIDTIEYQRCDGFIPFDHNRGGIDLILITNNAFLIGSGYHFGTSIETKVEASYNKTEDEVRKENPTLSDEEIHDKVFEIEADDYSGQAFRVRIMYEGDNTLTVFAGWDDDAPYYRWSNKAEFEKTIEFKNKSDLKTKLNKLLKKINELK